MIRSTSEPSAGRRRRLRGTTVVIAAAALLFVSACGSDDEGSTDTGSEGTTVDTESVLGTPDPATGEAVKVGFVSDGRTPTVDNSAFAVAAQATVDYVNEYRAGIGGHEIDLVTCETTGDPGKATECANELVQDGVVLTIMPESLQPTAVHTVLKASGIPLFVYAVTDPAILKDPDDTFNLGGLTPALAELPISVAQDNDLDKVTVISVDVPAATAGYEGDLAQVFEDADVELELVRVPLGQADITPQINGIVTGDPTAVFVVGDNTLCIAAINGLRANGFEGPIAAVSNCVNDDIIEAVGDNIEGLTTASLAPIGDESNEGIQLLDAILAEYAPDFDDPAEALTTFMTTYSALQVLADLSGEVTPELVASTINGMPQLPLVTGAGLGFRCNGKADPENPAACTRGSLKVSLAVDGEPVLPWEPFGDTPIPD